MWRWYTAVYQTEEKVANLTDCSILSVFCLVLLFLSFHPLCLLLSPSISLSVLRQPRYLLNRQSKTSAAVIEAHIVAASLPVRICLRSLLISASGVLMSAQIRMIYLQVFWKYASNTPEVMQDISTHWRVHPRAQMHMCKWEHMYNTHKSGHLQTVYSVSSCVKITPEPSKVHGTVLTATRDGSTFCKHLLSFEGGWLFQFCTNRKEDKRD